MTNAVSIADICHLVAKLRNPEAGCPWMLQQDLQSILGASLEEMYELVDAILQADFSQIQQELGDVLLHVVLYCQFAKEQQQFDLEDVLNSLHKKLIRRYPHVLQNQTLPEQTLGELEQSWQAIKQRERRQLNASILDDIPSVLPALKRAQKLQTRAAVIGFDWENSEQVLEKLFEEIAELQHAITDQKVSDIEMELGDVLFTVVNLARHLHVDAEQALVKSHVKFTNRFVFMETALKARQKRLEDCTMAELESLWQLAKTHLSD